MLIIHNELLLDFIRSKYTSDDIKDLYDFLRFKGVLRFEPLDNGLFPAAKVEGETLYTGYTSVWVRDNIHIAHAHFISGKRDTAIKSITSLMAYFRNHKHRFDEIIAGKTNYHNPMNRPHIRFNGNNLEEINQKWAHAQNDALGYFLWLYCKLAIEGAVHPKAEDVDILLRFPHYWQVIGYWNDEDSGHWEETRKISASSIGVVVAALQLLKQYLTVYYESCAKPVSLDLIQNLTDKGREKLNQILPAECLQADHNQYRRYDSALLFLIYPLNIVSDTMADQILDDVISNLQGDHGIRRYLGDSYWSADYKKQLAPESRTIDFSDDLSARNSLLKKGEEAQWCIFDPVVSVIFGLKYQQTKLNKYLELQTHYLNRSLGQITGCDNGIGEFLCPESYYLEDGRYMPSDPTPLYWTQANLMCALKTMENSLEN
ncbi:MAG: glycoside hydrolase family 15 protein [Desulfobacterales bacterium]